ncbi:hypothetical protein [Algicola sagamiensis]|uniref:hypothetical protein n=1 Tax=Algicola sagamiensis TaxID=163869 RepID=UPI00036BD716|nr:hypothetical protein [Algicola sagamiensis]
MVNKKLLTLIFLLCTSIAAKAAIYEQDFFEELSESRCPETSLKYCHARIGTWTAAYYMTKNTDHFRKKLRTRIIASIALTQQLSKQDAEVWIQTKLKEPGGEDLLEKYYKLERDRLRDLISAYWQANAVLPPLNHSFTVEAYSQVKLRMYKISS